MSPKAAGLAANKGYTNVRIFNDGMPAWKKAGQLVAVNADALAKGLDPHHVIVDVRSPNEAEQGHIKSAVNLPLFRLMQLDQQYRARKVSARKANLPGLVDKNAPVVLYSNRFESPEIPNAYKTVRGWGYKNVAVLVGGYEGWSSAGLPTGKGATARKIAYTKKLAPGAVPAKEFVSLVTSGKAVVLDVRTSSEVASGKIKGALAIPLDQLESHLARVPKDKPVLIHCASGARAGMAYNKLKEHGYTNARFLDETIEIDRKGEFCVDCS